MKSNLKTMVYDEDKVAQKELESPEENKNELIEMANRIEEI